MGTQDLNILTSIRSLLDERSIDYLVKEHPPTFTSEEAAAARGEELKIGGKALLVKCDGTFVLCVLSADRRLDSKALKQLLRVRKTRFASPEELHQLTGLVPGAVPPFGAPVISCNLLADESILENEKIAFNAGSLTTSIIMKTDDYCRTANPRVCRFSRQ